jgi:hypothetical protein
MPKNVLSNIPNFLDNNDNKENQKKKHCNIINENLLPMGYGC